MENSTEIEKLILKIKKWKYISILSTQQNEDYYSITLREESQKISRKHARRIIISFFQKKTSYSIESFEIHTNGDSKEELVPLFRTKVIGNIESKKIITDLKAIINGRDEQIFGVKSSFNLKV